MIFIFGAVVVLFFIRVLYSAGEIWFERDWPRATWRGLVIAALLLFLCFPAFGQVARFDVPQWTINTSTPLPGGLYPMLAFPNARVQVCATWTNGVAACNTLATTYTDSTGTTPCSTATQLVSANSGTCSANSDSAGGIGGFTAPGSYALVITTSYGTYGPYQFGVDAAGAYCPLSGCTLTGPLAAGAMTTNQQAVASVNPMRDSIGQRLANFAAYPTMILQHDANSWDSYGIGGTDPPLYIKGKYWTAVTGYSSSALSSAQAIGLASGPNVTSLAMYASNPIYTNALGATCIEGPTMAADGPLTNSATNVYIFFGAYFGTCDAGAAGNLQVYAMHTTIANFPGSWSTPVSVITKPASLNWMYRFRAIPYGGMWYGVMNAGDSGGNMVLVEFTATNAMGPWTLQGTILTNSESWCTGNEIQDPSLQPSATAAYWILWYSCDANGNQEGFATATSPTGPFTANPGNPVAMNGTPDVALGTMFRDASGQSWVISGANNVKGFWLSQAQPLSPVVGAAAGGTPAFVAETTGSDTGYSVYVNLINQNSATPTWEWFGGTNRQYFGYVGGGTPNYHFVDWLNGKISLGANSLITGSAPAASAADVQIVGNNAALGANHIIRGLSNGWFTFDQTAAADQLGQVVLSKLAYQGAQVSPAYTAQVAAASLTANRYFQFADLSACTSTAPCNIMTTNGVLNGATVSGNFTGTGGIAQTINNGQFVLYGNATYGTILAGNGSSYDLILENSAGTGVLQIAHSSTAVTVANSLITPIATLTAATPTVAAGQVGFGTTTTATTSCGTLASSAGCLAINVSGTTHYIPYY